MINNSHRKEIEDILRHWNDKTQVHNESMVLEYKGSFNYGGLSDYYRDFAAFANNKGGFMIYMGDGDGGQTPVPSLKINVLQRYSLSVA